MFCRAALALLFCVVDLGKWHGAERATCGGRYSIGFDYLDLIFSKFFRASFLPRRGDSSATALAPLLLSLDALTEDLHVS